MMIFPAIDIKDGKCVRLTQGNYTKGKIYNDDPLAVAMDLEKQGAQILHIVDLDGAKAGRLVNIKSIEKIRKHITIPLQVGGGVRSENDVALLHSLGINFIIVSTVALEDKTLFKKLLNLYSSSLVVSLDGKNGEIMTNGWITNTGKKILEAAKELETIGVIRLIYTDVERDGTLTVPNYKVMRKLTQTVSIPIIAAGGISSVAHIKRLKNSGAYGVIIGKALYEKKLTLKEALHAC